MNTGSVPFVLDSIEWDSPAVSMEKYRVPFQIGNSLSGIIVESRKPVLYGYVVADTSGKEYENVSVQEYYSMQEKEIRQKKGVLNKFISVYDDIVLSVEGYYITGRPTSPVKYSSTEKENNDVLCRFSVELECLDPMFYVDSRAVSLFSTVRRFYFPGSIPAGDGIIFGELRSNNIAYIENNGDVETGIKITIEAVSGSVINPVLRKAYTQEFLAFEGLIVSQGNTLLITTGEGKENAVLHDVSSGEDITVVGYVDVKSTFLKAERGTTIYTYEADGGTESNGNVTIEVTDCFFNIEGM